MSQATLIVGEPGGLARRIGDAGHIPLGVVGCGGDAAQRIDFIDLLAHAVIDESRHPAQSIPVREVRLGEEDAHRVASGGAGFNARGIFPVL